MIRRATVLSASMLALLPAATFAQFDLGSASQAKMVIKECVVYSQKDASNKVDCAPQVAKLCENTRKCDVPIGMALSAGKDLDQGNFKMVKITFVCGDTPAKTRGPYPQNDNATLELNCSGNR